MGKVIMSGIVPKLEAPVTFAENFADNTWKQIIEACQKNKVPDTWTVGSQKSMSINGTSYVIDIIGKHHDIYADGSGTAPLTFQMHDTYATGYSMNSSNTNSGGWEQCEMRTTHLPAILATMPSEVQSGIKEVNKLTTVGRNDGTVKTTADKLFLLSEMEALATTTYSYSGEGTQYEYYKAGNSAVKNCGSYYSWLLRSPYRNTNYFVATNYQNGKADGCPGGTKTAVSFAFCF